MSDTPEETARRQKLLEELWKLDEQIEEQMTTNNSSTNEVTNIFNKVVKCDCKEDATKERDRIVELLDLSTRKANEHYPDDDICLCDYCIKCECGCEDNEDDGVEGQLRGIRTGVVGLDESETGLVWGWKLVPGEGEPALFTNGQWVSLMPLIKGEQK